MLGVHDLIQALQPSEVGIVYVPHILRDGKVGKGQGMGTNGPPLPRLLLLSLCLGPSPFWLLAKSRPGIVWLEDQISGGREALVRFELRGEAVLVPWQGRGQ